MEEEPSNFQILFHSGMRAFQMKSVVTLRVCVSIIYQNVYII